MKYIVGLPIRLDKQFLDTVIDNKDRIKEFYFSWGDMPSGRSTVSAERELTAFEYQKQTEEALALIHSAGIKLNLLLNANCHGKDSQSRAFFYKIGNLIDFIARKYKLSSVTTASPLIAKFIKENFKDIDVRASVNMEIGTVEGISYVSPWFDSFYVKREMNRDIKALLRLRKWCNENGKQMYLLANSGCLNNCSAHIFHDNLVAHESEISSMDNGYQFRGVCWDFLSDKNNFYKWLERTNFIRPEDIGLYENITPAVKLATRVNSSPSRVLEAYVNGSYRGAVTELLEPNHSGAFYPEYIENSKIRQDFALHVQSCDKRCEECTFCSRVMENATVKLGSDPSEKV